MRVTIFLLSLLPGLVLAALKSTDPEPALSAPLTVAQWNQDIDALVAFLKETHPDLDATDPNLEREARLLKSDLPQLQREQIIGRIIRMVALTEDDSTFIYPFQERVDFSLIPLLTYWFSDGLYVIDARGDANRFIGHRITHIGGVSTDRAFVKLSPYLSAENMQGKRFLFTRNAFIPELLFVAGLSTSPTAASFTFVSPANIEETTMLEAGPADAWKSWNSRVLSFDAGDPMFDQHADEAFWHELQEDSGTLFIRIRELRDQENRTLAQFAEELRAIADSTDLNRVVIDARYGGGGSGHAMEPLVEVFTSHPRMNQAGRLFGLIGRVTRGTVLEFISVLENNSRLILVGESTMDAPNGVGDPILVTLPNSGIEVAITEVFWPTSFLDDPRRAIVPDVRVMYRHEDWKDARDPALIAVSNHAQHTLSRQPVSASIAEQLTGVYAIGPGQTMAITSDGDSLAFTINDSEQQAGGSFFRARGSLYAENGSRLSSDIDDVFIEFESTAEGIERPTLIWRGVSKPLSRLDEAPEEGSTQANARDTGA